MDQELAKKYISYERLAQFKELQDAVMNGRFETVEAAIKALEDLQLTDENGNPVSITDAMAGAVQVADNHTKAITGTPDEGKTLQGEIDAVEADVKNLQDALKETGATGAAIKANADAIATLNGDKTKTGSVAAQVDALRKELLEGDGVADVVDTFKDLQAYIEAHGKEAADMASAIDDLEAVVGAESKAAEGTEGQDGYKPAVAATGIFARIEDIEKNMGEGGSVASQIQDALAGTVGTVPEGKTVQGQLDVLNGTGEGSVSKAVADEATRINGVIEALDADITSDDADAIVTVQVTQVNGKVTDVVVTNVLTECSSDDIANLFKTEEAGEKA